MPASADGPSPAMKLSDADRLATLERLAVEARDPDRVGRRILEDEIAAIEWAVAAATQLDLLETMLDASERDKKHAVIAYEAAAERERALLDALPENPDDRAGITAPEDAAVRDLCEACGYGAVMDSAMRQWMKKDSVGALTVGPCAVFVREAHAALARAALDRAGKAIGEPE